MRRENIFVSDRVGVVYEGRTEEMNPYLARYARPTQFRKLAETMAGADIFLGLSAPWLVSIRNGAEHGGPPHHHGAGQPDA